MGMMSVTLSCHELDIDCETLKSTTNILQVTINVTVSKTVDR